MYEEPGWLSRYSDGLNGRDSIPGKCKVSTFYKSSIPVLGPIQPPIQWVPRAVSQGIKRPGCEDNHSPPSSTEIKTGGAIPSLLHTSKWCDV
jgi:hypothetical protein